MKFVAILVVLISLNNTASAADTAKTPTYGPFEGSGYVSVQGYQEISLGTGRWYVAYQGNADTSPAWVEAAWSARSAQLCKSVGHFVALRYVSEAVGLRDEELADVSASVPWRMVDTASPVYIPIFTPSGPRTIVPLTAPSRLGAIRCISDPAILKDPSRAIGVSEAMSEALRQGVAVPP